MKVYKVTHTKGTVETVYLVSAESPRQAETEVLDSLYDRRHRIRPPLTPEQREGDVFGLLNEFGDWTNYKLCEINGCSVQAQVYQPDVYRLYSIDTSTGAVS